MAERHSAPSVFDRLLKDRIIWLGSEVRDDNANEIAAKLLLLAAEDPKKDIYLYINSPGGSITAGMAIYDTMQFVPNDIVTVGIGMAASMGQLLLTAGTKGKRYITPNARVLLHQPHGGFGGTSSDIQTQAQLILDMKKRLAEITAAQTGKSVEQINDDGDRDRWFNAAGGPRVRLRRPHPRVGDSTSSAAAEPQASSEERERANEHPHLRRHRLQRHARPRARATSCRASRSARPTATSARTRTPSSSRTASSSSACRSTTPRPTTSWPSCSCSSRMDPDRDIIMYINSPGGSFTAMTAIYDTMQYIRPQIQTVVLGQAASAAAVIAAAGTPGKRLALPNARILIHQPAMGEAGHGQASDIEIQAAEILRMRTWLEETLSQHSNRTQEQVNTRHRPRQDPLGRGGRSSTGSSTRCSRRASACRRSPGSRCPRPNAADERPDGRRPSAAFGAPEPLRRGGSPRRRSRCANRDRAQSGRAMPLRPELGLGSEQTRRQGGFDGTHR